VGAQGQRQKMFDDLDAMKAMIGSTLTLRETTLGWGREGWSMSGFLRAYVKTSRYEMSLTREPVFISCPCASRR
jgi:hypothetical protein